MDGVLATISQRQEGKETFQLQGWGILELERYVLYENTCSHCNTLVNNIL